MGPQQIVLKIPWCFFTFIQVWMIYITPGIQCTGCTSRDMIMEGFKAGVHYQPSFQVAVWLIIQSKPFFPEIMGIQRRWTCTSSSLNRTGLKFNYCMSTRTHPHTHSLSPVLTVLSIFSNALGCFSLLQPQWVTASERLITFYSKTAAAINTHQSTAIWNTSVTTICGIQFKIKWCMYLNVCKPHWKEVSFFRHVGAGNIRESSWSSVLKYFITPFSCIIS